MGRSADLGECGALGCVQAALPPRGRSATAQVKGGCHEVPNFMGQGFGCFKVLKKNKGFLLKLKGLPKPKKEKPGF